MPRTMAALSLEPVACAVYVCTRELAPIIRYQVTRRSPFRKLVAGTGRVLKIGLIVALNTLVLFVAANVGAALYLNRGQPLGQGQPDYSSEAVRREKAAAVVAKYGIDFFKRIYPDKSEQQIRDLITDQPELPGAYEPFVEFRSPAMLRPHLTIHQAGFRVIGASQGPWPLDGKALNIFVFGGSSVAGAGVEDDESIPAALQSILRERIGSGGNSVNVYNFGVGSYFSSQEVTYFQNQLRYGNVPDMVIFVDGQNDFHFWDGDPATAKNSRHIFYLLQSLNRQIGREQGVAWHFVELWRSLPVVQLVRKIRWQPGELLVEQLESAWTSKANAAPLRPPRRSDAVDRTDPRSDLVHVAGDPSEDHQLYSSRYSDSPNITDPDKIQAVITRYLMNKDIAQGIANQLGIEAIFAWQPTPLYKYNLAIHPFQIDEEHRRSRYGYPAMARYVAAHDMGANFTWCADIMRNADHALYVRPLYYSAEGNRLIADCIADTVMASGAIDRIRQRKLGQAAKVAARRDVPVADEADATATIPIGSVFGPQASTENMTMSRPLSEWNDIASSGVQLDDSSAAGFAVIYQYFPLERALADRTHQFSVRIKPLSSNYLGLAMVCVGGAKPESDVMFVNPETMGVIAASAGREVRDEPGGWTRLTMTATCKEPGHDRLQVLLYPAHGTAENRGAVVFGGGEVRRVIAAPLRTSGQGSTE